ncbi:TetR family transcriptional regulator [Catenulispora yoronensis]|uniref:TetR family transcriptional regulator n=1 Tax=Catenulispora yoronensis TaxID=450799 RepID=A0ABP5F896_9ACTN
MAWDTEKTKRLLLDAAVEEFAEHGFQGARVDRVAKSAGVNKERIYQYFGNKEQLFATVLDSELKKLAGAVPLTPEAAADLPEHVGQIYDYHLAHPHFSRLVHWEGLELGGDRTVPAEHERTVHYLAKVESIAAAQRAGAIDAALDPKVLMLVVVHLAQMWSSLPQVAKMLLGGSAEDTPEARRAAVVALTAKIVAP